MNSHSDTVGVVTLSSGSITGTTGVLTGTSYAVTNATGTTTISAILGGSGSLTKTGAGTLILSGANTYTGATTVNASTLDLENNNALSMNKLISADATLILGAGVVLPSLLVTGNVSLGSDIATVGDQTYSNQVTIASGDDVHPLTISTQNAAVNFNSTISSGANTYTIKRSLSVSAGSGTVTFNDRVGEQSMTYSAYAYLFNNGVKNLYDLAVAAKMIHLNADVTTLGTQTYNGAVLVGDNGANGKTRTIISIDPKIEFMSTIDDAVTNTHSLIVKAISTIESQKPMVIFHGAIGGFSALFDLTAITGSQKISSDSLVGDTDTNPYTFVGEIIVKESVTTLKDQTYSANAIQLDGASASKGITFSSKNGKINFLVGKDFNSGVTGSVGTKVTLKYSGSGSMSNESQRALRASGLKVALPVFDYQDAAVNNRLIDNAKMDETSIMESEVEVKMPLINICEPADKNCAKADYF
jgi:autotransporter-associated beta strand protein